MCFIEHPPEDAKGSDGTKIGKLRKTLYGTKDAPSIWQDEVTKVMRDIYFVARTLQSMVFTHLKYDLMVLAHVDNFLGVGERGLFELVEQRHERKNRNQTASD